MGDGGGTDYQNGIWLPKRSSAHSEGCFTVTQDLSAEDTREFESSQRDILPNFKPNLPIELAEDLMRVNYKKLTYST